MRRALAAIVLGGAIALPFASPAAAALPHVVQPGETLWSIAAANNLTTRTVAVYNGIAEDAQVVAGQTLQVPTVDEGAAALASAPAATSTASTAAAAATGSSSSHTVTPGESLSSIAAANGMTAATLASYNGLASDAWLLIGQTVQVPAGAATSTSAVSSTGISLGSVWSPYGTVYLRSDAASAWNAMRQQSLSTYGTDLYPDGSLSAYRTYDQQSYLYNLFLAGQGAPANPPGTSSHELGTAVDLSTPQMRWVIDQIGWQYGWTKVHGPDEWWHVDYVG
jgi:LysM repeat protein